MMINTLIILIVTLIISILIIIAGLWKFIKEFYHNNYSYFDVCFVLAYFFEQFALILLIELFKKGVVLWVSLFALIVITTASLQKLSADSRDKKLRELYIAQRIEIENTKNLFNKSLKENEILKNAHQNLISHIFDNSLEKK